MKYFTKEVKIALVAIVGVVVLFFGMNFLKGLNIFSSEDNYYVQFSFGEKLIYCLGFPF